MKINSRPSTLISSIIFIFGVCFFVQSASAQEISGRIIPGTYSTAINLIISDPISNTIYAADSGNRRLRIINAERESISSVYIGSNINDLAFSKNSARYLALATGAGIYVMDLLTDISKVAPKKVSLPEALIGKGISSVAFDAFGNLFITTLKTNSTGDIDPAYRINWKTGKLLNQFGSYYSGSVVRTDSSGTVVYVGGIPFPSIITQPTMIDRYKVTQDGLSTARRTKDDFCKAMKDFSVSSVSNEIFVACHSLNSVEAIDGTTMQLIKSYDSVPYSVGVDIGNNHVLYAAGADYLNTNLYENLYEFDLQTNSRKNFLLSQIPGSAKAMIQTRGLAVSKDASKVFVIVGTPSSASKSAIQVVSTGNKMCQ